MIKGTQEECKNMWIIRVIKNIKNEAKVFLLTLYQLIGNTLKFQEW